MTIARLQSATAAGFAPLPVLAAPDQLQPDRRRRALAALALSAVLVCAVVMPPVYALVAFHGAHAPLANPAVVTHIGANCLANLVVVLAALRARGRLDQRLASLFTLALVAHGALAFLILVTRPFYSIPMMLAGGAASVVLGAVAIWLRSQSVRLRVGVLGPWHPVFEDPNIDCVRLESTTLDLQSIDLVLVTFGNGAAVASEPVLLRALLQGKRVRHVAEYTEEAQGACALEHFDIDQVSPRGLIGYRPLKRAIDIALVLASLPLALPTLGLAALGIMLTMGRPVLYIQQRVGLGGAVFDMIKLRTMRVAATTADTLATTAKDPRITPFGSFLRRFRIDELPQILNVLRGEMSVIGPRPEWTPLAERYVQQEPKYALRHLVRPGITGWAQVRSGPAADLAETRVKLSYDFFYLKFASLALDMQILWRTAWTLVAGGGVR